MNAIKASTLNGFPSIRQQINDNKQIRDNIFYHNLKLSSYG